MTQAWPRYLLLHLPSESTNEQRGAFFEQFVGDILRPLRFRVEQNLRVTGMEIDILARGLDQPLKLLVECKAHRDPLPADTLSKLMGNVMFRQADAGWLFSTSALSKDGRGQWSEIQENPELSKKIVWYPPERIIDILIDQRAVVDPASCRVPTVPFSVGSATLICAPDGRHWLVELLRGGFPVSYCVFDAATGSPVDQAHGTRVASALDRLGSLTYAPSLPTQRAPGESHALDAPVARVTSGDAWVDLRPARPGDFVGRDEIIQDLSAFIESVRLSQTATRTFAVQGPSGWGKSSLVLKLVDLARTGRRIEGASITAVDSRSATSATFVSSALREAIRDAVKAGLLPEAQYDISSINHPLDSPDILRGAEHLSKHGRVLILIFDQFEELFAKEALFETFTAIRELSLDLDSKQLPVVLGFAWKTDVSLPQEHPAYHLWHELSERRKDFGLRQFASRDILKVVAHAEREMKRRLLPALRTRLVEQCQGYPWLLKKLLVHVGRRLGTESSQYALLERELDVEVLFKEDLEGLKGEQLRCLKYVAERAPAFVSEVDEQFRPEITNSLLAKGLLVRSGLNYVVYWDIFRDYLTERRVPQIPWARVFQRDPRSAVRAAQAVHAAGTTSVGELAEVLGGTAGSWINVMSDLVAVQVVDRIADDQYTLASHIKSTNQLDLALHLHAQLARHVVSREMTTLEKGAAVSIQYLEEIVRRLKATTVSAVAVHQYAMNLRRWLLFAGHLEERGGELFRPGGRGAQMGQLPSRRDRTIRFLGSSTPEMILRLLQYLSRSRGAKPEVNLQQAGFRNALYDAVALDLVVRAPDRTISLAKKARVLSEQQDALRAAVLRQPSTQILAGALKRRPGMAVAALGEALRRELKGQWKPSSSRRYAVGLRRFYAWATSLG